MSAHLDGIMSKHHGSANASVVFLDIIKYSMRKSIMQQKVVQTFNNIINRAIEEVSAKHVSESQRQNINLSTDIIKIPTGDGAAVVFPFQGMQNINLDFPLSFLKCSLESRNNVECDLFESNGWCNCHDFFDVRTGVSDGKVIIFRDANGNYNVAGNTVNTASRIMSLADRQQILFTEDSFKNIIDMTEDTALESRFVKYGAIKVKHDVSIEVCQYVGQGENFLSKNIPVQVDIIKRKKKLESESPLFVQSGPQSPDEEMKSLEIMEILKNAPMPPGLAHMFPKSGEVDIDRVRAFVEAMTTMNGIMQQVMMPEKGKIIDSPFAGKPLDNSKKAE